MRFFFFLTHITYQTNVLFSEKNVGGRIRLTGPIKPLSFFPEFEPCVETVEGPINSSVGRRDAALNENITPKWVHGVSKKS